MHTRGLTNVTMIVSGTSRLWIYHQPIKHQYYIQIDGTFQCKPSINRLKDVCDNACALHRLVVISVRICLSKRIIIPGLTLGLRPVNETVLLCNEVSHWLSTSLESDLISKRTRKLDHRSFGKTIYPKCALNLFGSQYWRYFLESEKDQLNFNCLFTSFFKMSPL